MIDLRPATESDDDDLRAMLHDNAMPSWVTMTLEREPSFLASLNRYGKDQPVIARQEGRPVGMYLYAEHPLHLNGQATALGYLGALRVNRQFRHRLRILRDGYASIRQLACGSSTPFWYTSVAADNEPARRLLEANLNGMPRYQRLGEVVTLALPRSRGRRSGLWRPLVAGEGETMCLAYNTSAARFHFSPALSPALLEQVGASFFVHPTIHGVACSMALWNQQAYKQVVARGYRQPLAAALPLYNTWARLSRRVPLPRINSHLDQTFLSFLAEGGATPTDVVALVRDALAICDSEVLTLGLHGEHPALPALRRAFKPTSYRTLVYAVSFDELPEIDDRPVQPEVAVL